MSSRNNRSSASSESGSIVHARWRHLRLGLGFFIVIGFCGLASWVTAWRAPSNQPPNDIAAPAPAPPRTAHNVPATPDPPPAQAVSTTAHPHRAEVRDLGGRLVDEPVLLVSAECKTSRSIDTPQFSQPLLPSERGCAFFVLYSHDGWSVASLPRTFDLEGRTTVFVLPIEADPNGEIVVSRSEDGLGIVELAPESILSKLGLTPGDQITHVNGASGGALTVEELLQAFDVEKGERVTLVVSPGEGDTAQNEIELHGLGEIE